MQIGKHLKFLIDTGSTISLISSKIYEQFQQFKINKTIKVKTATGTTIIDRVIRKKLPGIFQSENLQTWYTLDFDPNYDGLIGMDLLRSIGATIDVPKRKLITNNTTIDLEVSNPYRTSIPPGESKVVRIPVSTEEGTAVLQGQEVAEEVYFQSALITCHKNEAYTVVSNQSNSPKVIDFKTPLQTRVYKEKIKPVPSMVQRQVQFETTEEFVNNLQIKHPNLEAEAALKALLMQYDDIFYKEGEKLTFTHRIKHALNMKDEKPIYVRQYRQPPRTKKLLKQQIAELLKQDIIRPSISPWASPAHIVETTKNSRHKVRMVIDYRRLNENMIEDKYPLPNISDILDKMGRSQYFSSIDLASGYHQVEMDPKDVEKTAFVTEQGHYEFHRMPFGLKNAPATFQRLMDDILKGLLEDVCLVYLDDIVIYSTSLEEHIQKLKMVFERLRAANFKVKLEKSEFMKNSIRYLGHVLTSEGVKPDPEKVSAVINYPTPKTRKEIKGFLGLLGYYRKFIKDFARVTKPLTKCLKKNAKIELTKEYLDTVERCKTLLTNEPVLKFPDFERPFILTTDASNIAVGAVLSQGTVGSDHPVCFASRTLNETEQRYSTIEKELLGIIWAVKYFRPYLYGRRFTIYTDHRPLVWLWSLKEPNSKMLRWRLRLEEFDYEVVYKKGTYNTNADALSRVKTEAINALETSSTYPEVDEELDKLISEVVKEDDEGLDKLISDIIEEEKDQPEESETKRGKIRPEARKSPAPSCDYTIRSNATDEPRRTIEILEGPVNKHKNQLIFNKTKFPSMITITKVQFGNVVTDVRLADKNLADQLTKLIKEHVNPENITYLHCNDEIYKQLCQTYTKICSDGGPTLIRCTKNLEVLEKLEEQQEQVKIYHQGKTSHRGISETLKHLQQHYYWPNMVKTITEHVNKCEICATTKYERNPVKTKIQLTQTYIRPFAHVQLDTFQIQGRKFITLLDKFSKYGQAIETGGNSIDTFDVLIDYFSHHGVPTEISSDNGGEFKNAQIQQLCELYGIRHHTGTPYNHQSQADVERFHSTLLEHIRILQSNIKQTLSQYMKLALIAYNSSIHSSTNMTPFDVVAGHHAAKDPMGLEHTKTYISDYVQQHQNNVQKLYEEVKRNIEKKKESSVRRIQAREDCTPLKIGDRVFIKNEGRNKLLNPFRGPYEIIKINGDDTLEVKSKQNKIFKTHRRNTRRLIINPESLLQDELPGPGQSATLERNPKDYE